MVAPPCVDQVLVAATSEFRKNRAVPAATACTLRFCNNSELRMRFSEHNGHATRFDVYAPKLDANAPKVDAYASDPIPNLVFKKTALRAAKSREPTGLVHRPWPHRSIEINFPKFLKIVDFCIS